MVYFLFFVSGCQGLSKHGTKAISDAPGRAVGLALWIQQAEGLIFHIKLSFSLGGVSDRRKALLVSRKETRNKTLTWSKQTY